MAVTTTYRPITSRDMPGVDIVSVSQPADESADSAYLSAAALAYVASLHRRFWDRRRDMLAARDGGASSVDAEPAPFDADSDLVHCRGWHSSEASILVDGSAVPGSVFDVAVAMHEVVDELRAGTSVLTLCVPVVECPVEARLWSDLVNVAEDRLGVDRGTVRAIDMAGHSLLD